MNAASTGGEGFPDNLVAQGQTLCYDAFALNRCPHDHRDHSAIHVEDPGGSLKK